MYLSWLLKNVFYRLICGSIEIPVSDILYDSRKNVDGGVFVCLKGLNFDGHNYVKDVIGHGARAVVVEKGAPYDFEPAGEVTMIEVENTREALGEMSRAFFDYPERKLKMIGITGTKGKTTVAGMLRHVFECAGIKTGIMGTIEVSTGRRSFPSLNTTPESYMVQKYLSMMVEDGCRVAVMEVSSQALMCARVFGVRFDYGIITNISPDHIGPGEHKNFADYVHWKGQLFKQCRVGIANGMDANVVLALKGHTCAVETFGLAPEGAFLEAWAGTSEGPAEASEGLAEASEGLAWASEEPSGGLPERHRMKSYAPVPYDYYAENIRVLKDDCPMQEGAGLGVRFDAVVSNGGAVTAFYLSIPGRYNVVNALPVIAVARHFAIDERIVQNALFRVRVTGRCELLARIRGGYFILDYAHNGKSLESVLKTLREYDPNRLICIFGCGGNRSKIRRTDMARAAVLGADEIIVTTDNPRYEAPREIIHDIVEEIEKNLRDRPGLADRVRYTVVEDRRMAIRYGLSLMGTGDIVLLAGKGHETYQEIEGHKYPFDEHEVVRDAFMEQRFMAVGKRQSL